jgi:aspartate oxidase
LERDAEGLHQLARDEYPLARLIAACALTRAESRGAHQRRDFPELDHGLDSRHVTVRSGVEPAFAVWQ